MLSTGKDYLAPVNWTPSTNPRNGSEAWQQSNSSQSLDVNGDGLADYVSHLGGNKNTTTGSNGSGGSGGPDIPINKGAILYLSTGSGFELYGTVAEFKAFRGTADMDGDGLPEIIGDEGDGSSEPHIHQNTSAYPNLLTSVTDMIGGVTEISYMPSSSGVDATAATWDNELPFVSQVVASITRKSGIARAGVPEPDRVTSYRYHGARYDYDWRRSLGFKTVTAVLPTIDGEGSINPELITEYDNSHIATKGVVLKRSLVRDGTTWSETENTWSITTAGNGPFRVLRSATEEGARHGSGLIKTRMEYVYDN